MEVGVPSLWPRDLAEFFKSTGWAFYGNLTPNRPTSGWALSGHSRAVKRSSWWKREGANQFAPFMTLIISTLTELFPESFHAASDTRAAACHNLIAAGVEDLKGNLINERVSVNTYLDRPREPVRLYPGPSSTKDEGVAHRGVIVALCVPPDPQLRRE